MSLVKYQNQSDYAFLIWMGSFPRSGHWLDQDRFHTFAKTVAMYRNKKWLDYDYFEGMVLAHTSTFEKEEIEKFYYKLRELVRFYKASAIPTVGHVDDDSYGIYQRGVKKGKIYDVEISQEEYYKGGATKETMKNADHF